LSWALTTTDTGRHDVWPIPRDVPDNRRSIAHLSFVMSCGLKN
jgi:hypothetical protein